MFFQQGRRAIIPYAEARADGSWHVPLRISVCSFEGVEIEES